jgi:PAS domain S-box-containing protein
MDVNVESILKYEQILDILGSIPDGIVVADSTGKYIYLNSAYERITGLKRDYVIGKNVRDMFNTNEISNPITFDVVNTKKKSTIVQNFIKTGKKVVITGNPMFDENGEVIAVVSTLHDISETLELQKRLDETITESRLYKDEILRLYKSRNIEDIIYTSKVMDNVMTLSNKVADFESNVLILGETGVGKEKIARYIHLQSSRGEGPFVAVNCGSLTESLMESELFGYEGGAFTGAKKTGKIGLIEFANNGVLFLDEVGELSLNTQVKLLRVLQEKKIIRVGSVNPINVDFRLICATNKDLYELVEKGKFREDLYYRICVVPIEIPPLRQRKEDIPQLVFYFIKKYNKKYGLNKKISPEIMSILISYKWPGNVRELENMIERLIVTSNGDFLIIDPSFELKLTPNNSSYKLSLKTRVEITEKEILVDAYKKFGTTRAMASNLGVNQSTIVRKMKKYEII